MEHGSGSIGDDNTFRVLGWKIGILVFVMDMGKGFLAALLGYFVGGTVLAVICSVVAVLGHTFSLFLHFKGGEKGLPPVRGALLFLVPTAFVWPFLFGRSWLLPRGIFPWLPWLLL